METTNILLLAIAIGVWVLVILWIYGLFFVGDRQDDE